MSSNLRSELARGVRGGAASAQGSLLNCTGLPTTPGPSAPVPPLCGVASGRDEGVSAFQNTPLGNESRLRDVLSTAGDNVMLIRILAVVALLATSAVWAVKPAAACSCPPPDAQNLLEKYDAAFVGRAVSVTEPRPHDGTWSSAAPVVYTFDVTVPVKGDLGEQVEVHSAWMSASCGLGFNSADGRYTGLVLRLDDEGKYHSGLCMMVEPDDLVLAAAQPGHIAVLPPLDPPPEANDPPGNTEIASNSEPQPLDGDSASPLPANSSARDIALWSAVSFGGLAAVLFGFAGLRMLVLRKLR